MKVHKNVNNYRSEQIRQFYVAASVKAHNQSIHAKKYKNFNFFENKSRQSC